MTQIGFQWYFPNVAIHIAILASKGLLMELSKLNLTLLNISWMTRKEFTALKMRNYFHSTSKKLSNFRKTSKSSNKFALSPKNLSRKSPHLTCLRWNWTFLKHRWKNRYLNLRRLRDTLFKTFSKIEARVKVFQMNSLCRVNSVLSQIFQIRISLMRNMYLALNIIRQAFTIIWRSHRWSKRSIGEMVKIFEPRMQSLGEISLSNSKYLRILVRPNQ